MVHPQDVGKGGPGEGVGGDHDLQPGDLAPGAGCSGTETRGQTGTSVP